MVYTLDGGRQNPTYPTTIPSNYEKGKIPSARFRYAWKQQFIRRREREREREKNNTSLTSWPPSGDSLRTRLSDALFCFLYATHTRLGVGTACRRGHGPVVFGNAGPEYPDHDDGEQSEQGGEEAAVDGAV
jgi:hypothetical protein